MSKFCKRNINTQCNIFINPLWKLDTLWWCYFNSIHWIIKNWCKNILKSYIKFNWKEKSPRTGLCLFYFLFFRYKIWHMLGLIKKHTNLSILVHTLLDGRYALEMTITTQAWRMKMFWSLTLWNQRSIQHMMVPAHTMTLPYLQLTL